MDIPPEMGYNWDIVTPRQIWAPFEEALVWNWIRTSNTRLFEPAGGG
jgi:hypothetical protein